MVKGEFFNDLKEDFKDFGKKANKLFDDLVKGEYSSEFELKVDAWESSDMYFFQADLPGMTKEDVKVQIKESNLIIRGERQKTNTLGETTYHLKERGFGPFQRSFVIPSGVDTTGIKAKFNEGTITISFPKEAMTQKENEINID